MGRKGEPSWQTKVVMMMAWVGVVTTGMKRYKDPRDILEMNPQDAVMTGQGTEEAGLPEMPPKCHDYLEQGLADFFNRRPDNK